MIDIITENLQSIGPVFAVMWILTIIFTIFRPQSFTNSILLMGSIMVTMIFLAGFFGEFAGVFLLVCYIIIMIALFMVPAMLIINGIQMIRKESVCAAHLLSLGLGIVVGIGELATVIYIFTLYGAVELGTLSSWVMLLAGTVFYFSCLVLSFVLYTIFIQCMPHRMNFDYVIIHGAGLAGGERLTKILSNRVDKAIEIYNKCKVKPVIIPSGGQGDDEKISEAQAMTNYLIEHGVPEEDIIMEDKSATTEENIGNSKAIIDARGGSRRTALISSNYHIYRCLRLARSVGLKCTGIGAKVALYYWPSALIREFIAVFVTKRFFILSMTGWLIFVSPLLYRIIYSLFWTLAG